MRKIVVFAFLFVYLLSLVNAVGITPGRTTLDYEPGSKHTIDFSVVNSEKKDMNLIVLVQGELNGSISTSEVSFKMSASEAEKRLSYTFIMPNDLRPGPHNGEVVVIKLPDKSPSSDTFIGAAVGVATQVYVFVPYPGKYAEASLNVVGQESNSTINFVMPVVNQGKQDLTNVRANIDIYGALNEKVATINSNSLAILSGERKELVVPWTANVAPGNYRAVATLLYDEQSVQFEQTFAVGSAEVDLNQIEINDFSLGQIAKFEMLVENKWSSAIKNAYAQMLVYDNDGKVIADFKSQTYDLPSLSKTLMVAFWDTAGIRQGTYPASVYLKYGDKSTQKDFKLEVSQSEIRAIGIGYVISKQSSSSGSSNSLVIVLITVIVVLVLVNLLWFLVLRKKLAKR